MFKTSFRGVRKEDCDFEMWHGQGMSETADVLDLRKKKKRKRKKPCNRQFWEEDRKATASQRATWYK